MTDLWDEKPEIKMDRFRDGKATHRFYDAKEMDAWLEKLKAEWDAILKHHVVQEEGMTKEINELKDKLEAIKKREDERAWMFETRNILEGEG